MWHWLKVLKFGILLKKIVITEKEIEWWWTTNLLDCREMTLQEPNKPFCKEITTLKKVILDF